MNNAQKLKAFGYNIAKGMCKILDAPEKRETINGKVFATARASFTSYTQRPGEAYTTYFSLIAFGKNATRLINNFQAGDFIRFIGKIYQKKYFNEQKNTESISLNVHILSMSKVDKLLNKNQMEDEYFSIEILSTLAQDPRKINDDTILLNVCYPNNSDDAEFITIFAKEKYLERLAPNEQNCFKKGKIIGIKFLPYGVKKTTSSGKIYIGVTGQATTIFYVEDLIDDNPLIAKSTQNVELSAQETKELYESLFLD
ncbi:hypothetical protein [Mycoplasmopsis cynos]|uniref:hypothetical protein n=1 Tax=Mycoplasmopsis cynos TaxID=171284 RepID=UPI0030D5F18F